MSSIITRAGKGSALTHNEMDTNLKTGAQAKTGAYTVVEGDNRDTVECSGTFAVTMPDVATVAAAADTGDFEVTIKNTGSGVITIDRTTGADTIDGTAADLTLAANDFYTLKTNQAGDGYNIISSPFSSYSPVLLSTKVISGIGSVSFEVADGFVPSEYSKMKIEFYNLTATVAAMNLTAVIKIAGVWNADSVYASLGSISTFFNLHSTGALFPSIASGNGALGEMEFTSGNTASSLAFSGLTKMSSTNGSSGAQVDRGTFEGFQHTTIADTEGVKILPSSGLISGTFRLWGIP